MKITKPKVRADYADRSPRWRPSFKLKTCVAIIDVMEAYFSEHPDRLIGDGQEAYNWLLELKDKMESTIEEEVESRPLYDRKVRFKNE